MTYLYFKQGRTLDLNDVDAWEYEPTPEPGALTVFAGDEMLGMFFTDELLGWYTEPEKANPETAA